MGERVFAMDNENRVTGWKAIGNYLGKERTTAMRWAADRALPVHRIPGGKQSSVYALTHELDAWMRSARDDAAAPPFPAPVPPDEAPDIAARQWAGRRWIPWVLAGAVVLAGLLLWRAADATPRDRMLQTPSDPQMAQLFLSAREQWARRDAASLEQAIASLQQLTKAAPDFAPGHAALAESWLLAREFGASPDREAFAEAEKAARAALRIDPELHTAHRAAGFVDYWWHRRSKAAGERFRTAIRLYPGDAQTYFWYANILSDNGKPDQALAHFERAMALQPGNLAMQIDYAWVHWEAGHDDRARALLHEIEPRAQGNAVYQVVSAVVALAEGDWPAYAAHYTLGATARGEPARLARAEGMQRAAAQGDEAIAALAFAFALEDARESPGGDLGWAALIAAVRGDRSGLLGVLRAASARGEKWGNAGYRMRIANRYGGDSEVVALLNGLRAAPVE